MKKILPLIALVILFATACKKDKNEPEPTPESNIPQWLQDIDGKKIKFTEVWSRVITGYAEISFDGLGIADTLVQAIPYDSSWYVNNSTPDLHEIEVVQSNIIKLKSNNNHIEFYALTNKTNNVDYYVFTLSDSVKLNQVLNDTTLSIFYDPTPTEKFVNGQQANIPNYDNSITSHSVHRILYIPKSTNLPILKTDLWHNAGSYIYDIDWNNPQPHDTTYVNQMNQLLRKNIPFSFYEKYTDFYAIELYENGVYRLGGYK